MPTLYVVATPIGNLEDITLRALRVLREVALIAAEDTRVTRKLLTRHGVSTRLTSFHDHTSQSKLNSLVATLTESDVALVSDAGMPGISDPGQALVRAAAMAGIPVVPVSWPFGALRGHRGVRTPHPADHLRRLSAPKAVTAQTSASDLVIGSGSSGGVRGSP